MPYDINKIRKNLKNKVSSRRDDQDQFKAPTLKEKEKRRWKFFILPPLSKGDKCKDGEASRSVDDGLPFVVNGVHWINKRPHACPRVLNDDECPICQMGFDLFEETSDKKQRSQIAKKWLPQTTYLTNVYFPPGRGNPEELEGKIMYYPMQKTIFDKCVACLENDSAGDPEEPEAFGVFFDENAALIFKLEAIGGSQFNKYDSSKFMFKMSDAGTIKTEPIADSDEEIQSILDQRIDLFKKIDEPNIETLNKLLTKMTHGVDDDDDDDDEKSSSSSSDDDDDDEKQTKRGRLGKKKDSDDEEGSSEAKEETSEEDEDEKTSSKKESKKEASEPEDDDEDDEDVSDIINKLRG